MNRELIVVQRLVDALDDSRSLYDKGADKARTRTFGTCWNASPARIG